MSEQPLDAPLESRHGGRQRGLLHHRGPTPEQERARLRRLVAVPSLVAAAVTGAAAASPALAGVPWPVAAGIALVGAGMTVLAGYRHAGSIANSMHKEKSAQFDAFSLYAHSRLEQYANVLDQGYGSLEWAVQQVADGRAPVLPEETPQPEKDRFDAFQTHLVRFVTAGPAAVFQAAAVLKHSSAQRQVAASTHLAQRLHALVLKQLVALDDLENKVDDPVILPGLFAVDNLATIMRRLTECIAVLGGHRPRQLTGGPVALWTVLHQAIAATADYRRVRVLPLRQADEDPQDVSIPGRVAPPIMLLLSALVENAARFSPSTVIVRTELVAAGHLAIEIEDRGLGMPVERLEAANRLLAEPDAADISNRLSQGLIGLPITADIARRYGIRVRLTSNQFDGITAEVVIPRGLIELQSQQLPVPPQPTAYVPERPAPSRAVRDQAAPLPTRRPVPPHVPTASPVHAAAPGAKPVLPVRPGQPSAQTRSVAAAPAPAGEARTSPGFVANFSAGVQRALQQNDAPAESDTER